MSVVGRPTGPEVTGHYVQHRTKEPDGIWERTEPAAPVWRSLGDFREPLPLPADVSWRDRFPLSAGRDPHPLHH